MSQAIQLLIVTLKLFIPPLMLKFPFFSLWANYFWDVIDGDMLKFLGMSESFYQTLDKSIDLYSYIFMFWLGLRLKIKKLVIGLFIYRLVGQLLFFLIGNELVFFLFQNFLEPLLMIYTLILFVNKGNESKAFLFYKKHQLIIWLVILGYKIWNEWYLHVANIDLSQFFFGISS